MKGDCGGHPPNLEYGGSWVDEQLTQQLVPKHGLGLHVHVHPGRSPQPQSLLQYEDSISMEGPTPDKKE